MNKTQIETIHNFNIEGEGDEERIKNNIATVEFEDFNFFKDNSTEYNSELVPDNDDDYDNENSEDEKTEGEYDPEDEEEEDEVDIEKNKLVEYK